MKKTGQILKEKREAIGLSISEVALATKINPKVLSAIEAGDVRQLPAKTFLKGFVRSYALHLKMDVDEVLRSFQEEVGGPAQPERVHEAYRPETPGEAKQRRRVDQENTSGMRTIAVVVIVVLIGLIVGVRELIEKYQKEKVVTSVADIKVSPIEANKKAPEPDVEANDNGAPVEMEANSNEVKTPEVAATKPTEINKTLENKPVENKPAEVKPTEVKPVAAAKPIIPPTVSPAPQPAAKATVTPPTTSTPATTGTVATKEQKPVEAKPAKPELVPPPKATVVQEKTAQEKPVQEKAVRHEIILEALGPVNIRMQVKGEVRQLTLAANQVHTIHADQPVILDLSDGGAVNIILDGREKGVPGDLGRPKQIRIP